MHALSKKNFNIKGFFGYKFITSALFCFPPPPPHHQIFFRKISENIITNRFEYKPESFSFKLILEVTVKDSDTNFLHTLSFSGLKSLVLDN